MQQLFSLFGDYLAGKPIHKAICKLLSVLFSACITAYLFEKLYFRYQWIDIKEYKLIIDFFLKGDFIVPLILFFIVHFFIGIAAKLFFGWITHRKSNDFIAAFSEFKSDVVKTSDDPEVAEVEMKELTVPRSIVLIYTFFKRALPMDQWLKIERDLSKYHAVIESYFVVTIRGLICTTLFFCTVAYFGIKLYVITVLLGIMLLALLVIGEILLSAMPKVVKNIGKQIEATFVAASVAGQSSTNTNN